jgi:hypothetical protein
MGGAPVAASPAWRVLVGDGLPAAPPETAPPVPRSVSLRGTALLLLVLVALDAVSRATVAAPAGAHVLGHASVAASALAALAGLVAGRSRGAASSAFRLFALALAAAEAASLVLMLVAGATGWAWPALLTQACAATTALRAFRRARRPVVVVPA